MGKASRDKGAKGERELAGILRDWYGYDVKRGMVFLGQSDLIGLPGVHVEVKRVERLNIHDAMAQAVREAEKRKDGVPVVFHRRNRTPWLVTMLLEDWVDFYGGWNGDTMQDDTGVSENPQRDHDVGST